MTFSIPQTNVVASDEGFTVEVVSPTEMHYVEDAATWRIEMEFLAIDAVPLVIYQNTIVAVFGRANDRPSEFLRERIVENVRRAMRFRQTEIQVM